MFFTVFSASLVNGGSTIRSATGTSTYRYTCGTVSPSAVPAAHCPRGIAPIPAEIPTAIRADIYSPIPTTEV